MYQLRAQVHKLLMFSVYMFCMGQQDHHWHHLFQFREPLDLRAITTLAVAMIFTLFSWFQLNLHNSDHFKESVLIEDIYCLTMMITSLKFYPCFKIRIMALSNAKGMAPRICLDFFGPVSHFLTDQLHQHSRARAQIQVNTSPMISTRAFYVREISLRRPKLLPSSPDPMDLRWVWQTTKGVSAKTTGYCHSSLTTIISPTPSSFK